MVVIELLRCRLHVVLPHRYLLLRIGLGLYPPAAVETGVVDDRRVVDHRSVDIGIVDDRSVDIDNGRVITEITAMPLPADKP